MLVSHPETNTCFPGPYWGKEEHIESSHVPLMIRTVVSLDPEIPVSADSSTSCVPDDGSGNMLSGKHDW